MAFNGYEVKGLKELESFLATADDRLQAKLVPVVRVTAELARTEIIDRITNKIRPHMAYRGKLKGKRIRRLVTDLVDTGFLRASWNVRLDGPTSASVITNVKYAPVLEYGSKDGKRKGYFFVRDTVNSIAPKFRKKCEEAVRSL